MVQNKLITIGKAAKILGISIDTLRRWDKRGKLLSVRLDQKGYRYYRLTDIKSVFFDMHMQHKLAKEWVESNHGFELEHEFYCKTRDIFQARLERLQADLSKKFPNVEFIPLVTAIVGEIGNNSFDHNLGNWRDVAGIFFYFEERYKTIILADRGQGILSTLKRVKPDLEDSKGALRVAFTETISGRQPEARGNGLKFVRSVVNKNPLRLTFQTGNAYLELNQKTESLEINELDNFIHGCFATITIKKT